MALATESSGWGWGLELAVEAEKVTPMVVRELDGWGSKRKKREREVVRNIDRGNMAEDGRREISSAAVWQLKIGECVQCAVLHCYCE